MRGRGVGVVSLVGVLLAGMIAAAQPSSALTSSWPTVNHRHTGTPAKYVVERDKQDYAPSVIKEGSKYRMWWCGGVPVAPGSTNVPDYILYAESTSLDGPWHAQADATMPYNIVLSPSTTSSKFDSRGPCDPSVVRGNRRNADGTSTAGYFMYYGALSKTLSGNLTAIGVAFSVNGITWTRMNSGNPIITQQTPCSSPGASTCSYGAGQPSVSYTGGNYYMVYTDTTGTAGRGVYVLRSSDPLFLSGVQVLTADGFAARTSANRTAFTLKDVNGRPATNVELLYVPQLGMFATGQGGAGESTEYKFWTTNWTDSGKRVQMAGCVDDALGIVGDNYHNALPYTAGSQSGFILDHIHGLAREGCGYQTPDGSRTAYHWDLVHRGVDVITADTTPAPPPSGIVKDFDGDGQPDFYAVDPATGNLNMFGRNASGAIGFKKAVDSGWNGARQMVSGGDYDRDGHSDVLVWTDNDDQMRVVRGAGNGALVQGAAGTVSWGTGWNSNVKLIAGGADYSGDGSPDLMAIFYDGWLRRLNGNGAGGYSGSWIPISWGWAGVSYLVGGGDYTGDGLADLYAVQDGSLYLEPGTSGGGIGSARFISAGWAGVSLVGGGNFSGAGGVDLLGAHPASDSMYLYTNNNDGLGTLVGAQPVGTGWAHYVGADGRLVVG